jgi:hypothetical protein
MSLEESGSSFIVSRRQRAAVAKRPGAKEWAVRKKWARYSAVGQAEPKEKGETNERFRCLATRLSTVDDYLERKGEM